MALTASAATANGLNDALQSFQGVLTVDQRRQLQEIQSVPDADAVLIFTAELDAQNAKRKGRSVATRLYTFLQCARDFSAVVDTFIQSNPQIAALVWGSVKLTMLVGFRKAWVFEGHGHTWLMSVGAPTAPAQETQDAEAQAFVLALAKEHFGADSTGG